MSVISASDTGCSDDGLLLRECRRRSIPEASEQASGQVAATTLDEDQERRERLPVWIGAVSPSLRLLLNAIATTSNSV